MLLGNGAGSIGLRESIWNLSNRHRIIAIVIIIIMIIIRRSLTSLDIISACHAVLHYLLVA